MLGHPYLVPQNVYPDSTRLANGFPTLNFARPVSNKYFHLPEYTQPCWSMGRKNGGGFLFWELSDLFQP